MPESAPRIVELAGLEDDLLLPWLDLYETAFPPTEKMLVSDHLRILRARSQGGAEHEHLLAAVDEAGAFLGMARWELDPARRMAWLWYLATLPAIRGKGLGAAFYREVVRRAAAGGAQVVALEVETPAHLTDEAQRSFAERRIAFYRREGARLLGGVRYVQRVGDHQPAVEMHLMAHCLSPQEPDAVFGRLAEAIGADLSRVGPISLE